MSGFPGKPKASARGPGGVSCEASAWSGATWRPSTKRAKSCTSATCGKMYSAYKYFPTAQDLFGSGRLEARLEGVPAFCGDIFSPMVLGNLVHTSTVLLRRERALKAGFFNEKYRTGEDYPFHLKTCREGLVAYVDAVTIRYAIGLADALSAPDKLIQVATHFVQTLEQTLVSEKGQIQLPKALISDRLAEAYSWAGQEHLRAGKTAEARAYFRQSVRAKPASSISASWKSLTVSLLPSGADAQPALAQAGR